MKGDVFICNTSLIINGIPEKLEVDFLCDIKVLEMIIINLIQQNMRK